MTVFTDTPFTNLSSHWGHEVTVAQCNGNNEALNVIDTLDIYMCGFI